LSGESYELPKKVEHYVAALSRLYAQDGNRSLQEILVNAQIRVVEAWTSDNWNGGTYGHALFLTVPESLFLAAARKRDEIQSEIARDLNNINHVQNEHIAEVFLEMEVAEGGDWRQESGLLVTTSRTVAPDSAKRIWGEEGYRLFLSHKSEAKKEAARLKEDLKVFGVAAFVAHEDIHPTHAWQDEIENALHTMDAFVAVMTEDFHDSDWTDQEVGFALARGVPVIALRLGRDPYGFLGKFQALSTDWASAPEGIVKLLVKHDRMLSAYLGAVRSCTSFDNGNRLSRILPTIERLTEQQVDELVAAYNENSEVRGSFGFNGSKPSYWGQGLIPHLHRLGSRQFAAGRMNLLTQVVAKRQPTMDMDDAIPF
jgi:TIR domain